MIVSLAQEPSLDALADGALVSLARGGPAGPAFRVLYERHRGDVHRLLLPLLRDPALADDVCQETFFRAYRTLDRFDAHRPLGPWLARIARNLALNELRSRKKLSHGDVPERGQSDRLPREPGESRRVRLALEALPEEDRALVVERIVLDRPTGEIAESFGVSDRTIRTRIQAALERLLHALRTPSTNEENSHDLR